MAPSQTQPLPTPPASFMAKKQRILSALSVPEGTYTDKSPKGSVDTPILELIDELNGIDGVVTTSSCSGRVAVFVEGLSSQVEDEEEESDGRAMTGGPAGKGGGKWLFVSHDPVGTPSGRCAEGEFFTRLCGLSTSSSPERAGSMTVLPGSARLVKLSFSPLILHVQCATLRHARPLLAAAINAGFRESGVQSLRVLDDPDAGVTLGIRTAGLGFETVVGRVVGLRSDGVDAEVYEAMVSEEYLAGMFQVINERFEWNLKRRERLRGEVRRSFALGAVGEWEDKEVRRRRMREEGLRKKMEMQKDVHGGVGPMESGDAGDAVDGLDSVFA